MKMHFTTWIAGLALLLPVSASSTALAQTDSQGASGALDELSLRPSRRTPNVSNRPAAGTDTTSATSPESTEQNASETSEDDQAEKNRQTHLLGMKLVESEQGHATVDEVRPKSPAWNGGVRKGDHIKSMDKIPSKPYKTFVQAARDIVIDKKKGQTIRLTVMRDGKKQTLDIDARGNGEILSEGAKRARDIQEILDQDPDAAYSPEASVDGKAPGAVGSDSLSTESPNGPAVGGGTNGLSADERMRGAIRTRGGYVDPDNGITDGGLIDPTLNGATGQSATPNTNALNANRQANQSQARSQGLNTQQRQRFEQLQQQAQLEDGLNSQEENELRSLAARENQMTRFGQQLRELEARQARGDLNPREEARLTQMRQRADATRSQQNRNSASSQLLNPQLDAALGNQRSTLLDRQQQRQFERLSNRTQLSTQEQAELNQLRRTANERAAQSLQQEFTQLSRANQTGQTLNNTQQARLRQLQQTRQAITQQNFGTQQQRPGFQGGQRGQGNRGNFGPNRPQARGTAPDNNAVPAALQGQSNPTGAGSGIGTGSSPSPGSGIGTATGGGAAGGSSIGSGE